MQLALSLPSSRIALSPALVALLCTTVGIDCDSSAHQLAVSWAGLMAVAYPLGIPTGYWLLLRWKQAAIMADGRENDASLDPIRFLFANYSPNAWYFEPIVCVEKLILVGVVVFFFPGTLSQLGITAANASGFLSVYSWIKPFGEQTLDLHGVSAQVSVVAAVACATPPAPLTSPRPQHQFCILWIVIAAILIAATAALEAANGPDSNYETGLMSVILIGLTAVPAVLTLLSAGKWLWDKRAWCVRDAGGGEEDAMQEEAVVETQAAGTEDGQEEAHLSPPAGTEENKELREGVTDGELTIFVAQEETIAAQAATIAGLEKQLEVGASDGELTILAREVTIAARDATIAGLQKQLAERPGAAPVAPAF